MPRKTALLLLLSLALLPLLLSPPAPSAAQEPEPTVPVYLPLIMDGLQAPVLKWQLGGCFSSWCETGWYSSPAVANIDATRSWK
jgi:hypothetical protein